MSEQAILEIQADLCRATGNPLRMEIMYLLRKGPLSVNDVVSAMNQNQVTISRSLARLRNAGIVVAQREGVNILYHVANPKLMSVCDMMREVLVAQIGERSKLLELCRE